MQLTLWTYEGPPHVGAMRIATAMEGVHYVLHAPQGDTYADLLFTMIERLKKRPPVTYTTFQARDLGGDTAELFKTAAREAFERFSPQAMLVGSSCTAELIQDDPGGLCKALDLPVPVVALELPSYQRKENWGASETFYQLVRALAKPNEATIPRSPGAKPRCNILGPTALGFRHRDDLKEISKLLMDMGIDINVVAPLSATPADIARLSDADFNVVLYPEIATLSAQWLERNFKQPFTKTIPIGNNATRDFIAEVARLAGIDADVALAGAVARAAWSGEDLAVVVEGVWRVTAPRPAWRGLLEGRSPGIVRLRAGELGRWDSSLPLFVFAAQQWARERGIACDADGLPANLREVLSQLARSHETSVPVDRAESFLTNVGVATADTLAKARAAFATLSDDAKRRAYRQELVGEATVLATAGLLGKKGQDALARAARDEAVACFARAAELMPGAGHDASLRRAEALPR